MNPQYSQQLPPVTGNFPPQPNYNGNQMPPNSLPNQVAGLSVNNAIPNQQPQPPQPAYLNKPAIPPMTQPQPNFQQSGYGPQGNMPQPNRPVYNQPVPGAYNQYPPGMAAPPPPPPTQRPNPIQSTTMSGPPVTNEIGLPPNTGVSTESKMNPQYTQQQSPPLQPTANLPPQPNYNGNQMPPNSLPHQAAGLSLNNASPNQAKPLTNFPPQPSFNGNQLPQNNLPNQMAGLSLNNAIPNQPPFSVPPQAGYPNKQVLPPMTQPQANYPLSGYGPQGNMPQPNRPVYNQPVPGAYNQYPPGMAAPPPQRRLDPDQMPNPIQVMTENQRSITGPFVTNDIGAVPPLVTTKFTTHDQGNSGPRYIRSTMYNVPATPDMIKQTSVPFSLIISPFAEIAEGEINPPIVDFGELGPIRCVRCKAYMSPNMQFVDAGRRFRCPMCKASTDVPSEYFQHLDHAGQRVDKYERPELVLGTYEFVATKEYCRENKPSKPPAFIFVIDVSYNNIKSGLVHLLCREMKTILKNLPIDQGHDRSKMKVGFITYNNSVHFYNCKENLAQPQMMVVGDIHEMFMPLLDGFFVDHEESGTVIDALMEQIPKMFGETRETETILMPAIQAGLEAIKASECSGKLLVFHSSLPVSDAPGRLQNREDRKVLGTEKEKAILIPQNNTYNNLGQECVLAGCSVDLFIFNNSYIDLATIGQVARLSGGEIYKYTYFQADIDGPRVISDLIKNISRPIAFDAVMRVRTSAGIRPTEFYGHFFMGNTTDMDLASITSGKSIGIEIKHDDKLPPDDNVYIQVALLFTSCSGQRRIRILNLALKTCTQMADLFRCCDLDAMILYFGKQLMTKLLDSTPRAVREALETRCAQILACYRKNCASPTSAGQLILPECMKLLPLYVSCIMKNDAVSGGSDMSCDDRSYVMQFIQIMDLSMSVFYFYPRLIPIHDINPNETDIPAPIRCTAEKLAEDGAYVLENGIHLFIWVGLSLAPEFTQAVFSAPCSQQIDTDRPGLPVLENPLSKRVRSIIDSIQAERPRCMRVTVVRSRDKLENVLRHYLIEDRSGNGMASYVDYLCHLHKEIRALLS